MEVPQLNLTRGMENGRTGKCIVTSERYLVYCENAHKQQDKQLLCKNTE